MEVESDAGAAWRLRGPHTLEAEPVQDDPLPPGRELRARSWCLLQQVAISNATSLPEAWTGCVPGHEGAKEAARVRAVSLESPFAVPASATSGVTVVLGIVSVEGAAACDGGDPAALCLSGGTDAHIGFSALLAGSDALPLGSEGPLGRCVLVLDIHGSKREEVDQPRFFLEVTQSKLGSFAVRAHASAACSARGHAPASATVTYDLLSAATPWAGDFLGTGAAAPPPTVIAHTGRPRHRPSFHAVLQRAASHSRHTHSEWHGILAPPRPARGKAPRGVFVGCLEQDGIRALWGQVTHLLSAGRGRSKPRMVAHVYYTQSDSSVLPPTPSRGAQGIPSWGHASLAPGDWNSVARYRRAGAAVLVAPTTLNPPERGSPPAGPRSVDALLRSADSPCELRAFAALADRVLCAAYGSVDAMGQRWLRNTTTGWEWGSPRSPFHRRRGARPPGSAAPGGWRLPWTRITGCSPGMPPVVPAAPELFARLDAELPPGGTRERHAIAARCGRRRTPRWALEEWYLITLPLRWAAPDVVFLGKSREAADALIPRAAAMAGASLAVAELHTRGFAGDDEFGLYVAPSRWLFAGGEGARLRALAEGRALVLPPRARPPPAHLSPTTSSKVDVLLRRMCLQCAPLAVLSVARIASDKGPLLALRAAARLPARATRLHHFGTGPMEDVVAAFAAHRGVDLALHGHLPHTMGLALLQRVAERTQWQPRSRPGDVLTAAARERWLCRPLAVFVMTSLNDETWGIAAAEAMHAGVPVVTFAAGGTGDFAVGGETAIVVDPPRVASLASTLRELADPEGETGQSARARARAVALTAEKRALHELNMWRTKQAYGDILRHGVSM